MLNDIRIIFEMSHGGRCGVLGDISGKEQPAMNSYHVSIDYAESARIKKRIANYRCVTQWPVHDGLQNQETSFQRQPVYIYLSS